MAEVKTGPNPLFLREEELRFGMDLLLASFRDLSRDVDGLLEEHGLGHAQLRVLSLVRAKPRIRVSDAIEALGVTKQSFSRVLTPLVKRGLVAQHRGLRDGRERYLELSESGYDVERTLSGARLKRLATAYGAAGAEAVEGFRKVLLGMSERPPTEASLGRVAGGSQRRGGR